MDDDVMTPSTEPPQESGLGRAVVCLAAPDDAPDHFLDQEHALDAVTWCSPPDLDDDAWRKAAASGVREAGGDRPVHLIVTGSMVARALMLAVDHPELIKDLQVIDPIVDRNRPDWSKLLRAVRVPTLVVVAAPDHTTDLSAAQAIAGGVDNGVMVILDRTEPPGHRRSPASVNEWVTTFMNITEGLFDLRIEDEDKETTAHA